MMGAHRPIKYYKIHETITKKKNILIVHSNIAPETNLNKGPNIFYFITDLSQGDYKSSHHHTEHKTYV